MPNEPEIARIYFVSEEIASDALSHNCHVGGNGLIILYQQRKRTLRRLPACKVAMLSPRLLLVQTRSLSVHTSLVVRTIGPSSTVSGVFRAPVIVSFKTLIDVLSKRGLISYKILRHEKPLPYPPSTLLILAVRFPSSHCHRQRTQKIQRLLS